MPRSGSYGSCCGNLLCKLLQLVIYVGLVLLFWWLVFQPRLPRAAVTEVELWTFNLTDDANALRFNATVRIAVRNPNRSVGLYYDSLDAALTYHGASLKSVPLRPFYQHHRTTAEISAQFGGRADEARAVAAFYGTETNQGTYTFDVRLAVSLRMKLWFIKIGHFHPEFDCNVGFGRRRAAGCRPRSLRGCAIGKVRRSLH